MWIVMEIDGWQKRAKIHPTMAERGKINILVSAPLELLVRPEDRVPQNTGLEVTLYDRGRRKNGLIIFESA